MLDAQPLPHKPPICSSRASGAKYDALKNLTLLPKYYARAGAPLEETCVDDPLF